MGSWKEKRRPKKIGADQDDFDVEEIVTVRIHQTPRQAIGKMLTAFVIAVVAMTFAQVIIIPLVS